MVKKVYRLNKEVEEYTPRQLLQRFVDLFRASDLLEEESSWKEGILGIFEQIGTKAGYEPRREVLSIDLIWLMNIQNTRFLGLVLEYEDRDDGSLSQLSHEVEKKLIHVKSNLKCGVSYYDSKFSQTKNGLKYIESLIQSEKIKDPGKWLLILLKSGFRKDPYRVEVIGYELGPEGTFRPIGSPEALTVEDRKHSEDKKE